MIKCTECKTELFDIDAVGRAPDIKDDSKQGFRINVKFRCPKCFVITTEEKVV